MRFKFVIVDDHPLFRGALKAALMLQTGDADIIEVSDLESAKRHILDAADVDLVLLDLDWLDSFAFAAPERADSDCFGNR